MPLHERDIIHPGGMFEIRSEFRKLISDSARHVCAIPTWPMSWVAMERSHNGVVKLMPAGIVPHINYHIEIEVPIGMVEMSNDDDALFSSPRH